MEDNASVMSRREMAKPDGEEGPEESSWTMYFEDFFSEDPNIHHHHGHDHHHHHHHHHHHDNDSSMVSDAASFVGMKKMIYNVRVQEPSSSKKKRSREVSIASPDLEDTASSPSRSPNVCSMMNLLGNNNNRHEHDDTCNAKGKTSGQDDDDGDDDDGVGLSLDLKKKGLCLVPLSVVANYLG
ncbi:PREDICTED: uncharacterized transmembrane protein DDB_G0285607 [Tarenaya hassleriana]|uniref:uncharacterized transmembrane protein DDB_G0285607 n=1 Tax=Tarenaya hassleriana TaxID=28532 RepID=UPI00053C0DE1|nr:PREDICTED: uncharacterized transmembrane protein DDB_G0285607 [Tarenaya hassleriana]